MRDLCKWTREAAASIIFLMTIMRAVKIGVKRKISFGTRSADGTKSWETFFTVMDTCRKLGINFRNYLYDRISHQNKMPSLSSLIPCSP